ncbi:hypothetical protein [Colwellia psychrerythraea]|uniref:Uncharacterized protein n=1 Tax=Colwellia psychrerythraea TaxID=28229 RepID=A0A099L3R4_COLPS|nr:hypothetical protein [Colwellia psychrerythraea]KGJ97579.1 hypothetical protein GAB14E_1168 [Colwellia psychrerythraea]
MTNEQTYLYGKANAKQLAREAGVSVDVFLRLLELSMLEEIHSRGASNGSKT